MTDPRTPGAAVDRSAGRPAADPLPPGDLRLRVAAVAALVAAAAGAILSTTTALEPQPPGSRCEDRQVATGWLSERCAAELFAEAR